MWLYTRKKPNLVFVDALALVLVLGLYTLFMASPKQLNGVIVQFQIRRGGSIEALKTHIYVVNLDIRSW